MVFWLLIITLTIVALVLAFWPALKAHNSIGLNKVEDYSHDMAVYKDQLLELKRESERGLIKGHDVEQARVEIVRRLLAAEKKEGAARSNVQYETERRFSGLVLITVPLFLIPGIAIIMYSSLGSPSLEAQPLAVKLEAIKNAEMAASAEDKQLQQMVLRAENHLKNNPEDGRGWDVLAPIYFRLGEGEKAEQAYRNAIRLLGESSDRLSGLGQVSVTMSSGQVTPQALSFFERAIEIEDRNARALYFLGLAQAQSSSPDGAASYWKKIVNDETMEAGWRIAAAQGIAQLTRERVAASGTSLPGPDNEALQAAEQMSQEDRQAMVMGMVEQLDARLKQHKGSIDEWKRLIRAWVVLNKAEKAQDALERAVKAYANEDESIKEINEFSRMIGLGIEGAK